VDRVAAGQRPSIQGAPGPRFDPAWWDSAVAASPRLRFGRTPWAYLKIAEGCDRGCTFCAIPLMRGKLRSRSASVVEAEARALVERGVSELSLVSQDSVMWGRDTGEGTLADLLGRLERVEGLHRVRLMYLHPQGVTDELIDVILGADVVVDYFDLSLQHVSTRVLKGMGRWGGTSRFIRAIDRIRAGDPLAGIRATFIMGFPGESDRDAGDVESFVRTAGLDWVGVFGYSREVGTRSHDMADQVDEPTIRERVERVAVAADEAMTRRAASLVGCELEVLVERFDLESGTWVGRSHREAPEVDGEIRLVPGGSGVEAGLAPAPPREEGRADGVAVGDYLRVRVTGSSGADLSAAPVTARISSRTAR
jgi:ribosomal protein S12 methylthiotransferase